MKQLPFILVFCLGAIGAARLEPVQDEAPPPATVQQEEQGDEAPTGDYLSAEPTDPAERELRQKRGKRYDKSDFRVRESRGSSKLVISHWWLGMPTLPVRLSDAIVVGDVVQARAYLSNDKSGVYSEFSVLVHDVLKNSVEAPTNAGELIAVSREGGKVRFSAAEVRSYRFAHQGMPRVNRRYVFFLERDHQSQALLVLTAYELRTGRVFPLDGVTNETLPFAVHKNADEATFLDEIRNALKSAQQELPEGVR